MRVLGRAKGWMALVAAALLVGACGGDGPEGATLTLDNQSGVTIGYVYYSDCDDLEWGEDRLGDTEVIQDGDDRSFDVDAGCYDIRLENLGVGEGFLFAEMRDVVIDEDEEFVWEVQNAEWE